MSSSTFKILRQCENCGNMFEAQKRTTRFCAHRCASQNYKIRKKLEVKSTVEAETFKQLKPIVKALNIEMIRQKDFLKVNEVAALFNCSKQTVYRMIEANEIKAVNLRQKSTRIRRKDIEQLFDKPVNISPEILTINDCYLMKEIIDKYNISRNTIYSYGNKYKIKKLRQDGITYYSKTDIDNLFNL
jgi:excisionase family DNA binding protein